MRHTVNDQTTPIAIVGAAGYTGAELARIAAAHPFVEVVALFASERANNAAVRIMSDIFPQLRGVNDLPIHAACVDAILECGAKVIFLATPHEASAELAPALLAHGLIVIDLSAAFRLRDAAAYPAHYGFTHPSSSLLAHAVYGLPELNRAALMQADLIACAGCYPTSVILPLRPLVNARLLNASRPVIVDSASGVSGAGRGATAKNLFCEVSFQPYSPLQHRHQPEMRQETRLDILFTPHLLPLDRGIVSTIHVELVPGVSESVVRETLGAHYADEPFIRLLPEGVWSSIAAVERTNYCDISLMVDSAHNHLVIASSIDNLVKGAAGQAMQCMNIRMGFPETMGLLPIHAVGVVS
ncbi:MAG: N-acetyl-gamma-glutamyl-phosphate reductase [Phycisphaerales bacterium]|nr:N-acetyl-gamma-glutamyl-phosphate reductase [Phycisphaerales bacterium]